MAAEACDAGRISVNGKPQKAAYNVRPGDLIEIRFGEKSVKAEVLSTEDVVRREDAGEMYRIV